MVEELLVELIRIKKVHHVYSWHIVKTQNILLVFENCYPSQQNVTYVIEKQSFKVHLCPFNAIHVVT